MRGDAVTKKRLLDVWLIQGVPCGLLEKRPASGLRPASTRGSDQHRDLSQFPADLDRNEDRAPYGSVLTRVGWTEKERNVQVCREW